jgi:hypothetical protein
MTELVYDYGSPENNAKVLAALAELPPDIDDHISDTDFRPRHRPRNNNLTVEQARAQYREGAAAAKAFRADISLRPSPEDGPGRFRVHIQAYGHSSGIYPRAFQEMLDGHVREAKETTDLTEICPVFGEKFKYFDSAFIEARANQDHDFWAAVRASQLPHHMRLLLAHLDKFKFEMIDNDDNDLGFLNWAKELDAGIDHAVRSGAKVYDRVAPQPGDPEDGSYRVKPGALNPVDEKVRKIADGIRKRYAELILMEDAVCRWLNDHQAEIIWDLQRCYAKAVSWVNDAVENLEFADEDFICDECRMAGARAKSERVADAAAD